MRFGVFFPLCCAQPVLEEWACKHSGVMELPSGQLPISPAIMCWKKLVEKGAKTRGGLWCWGSPGDSNLPSPLELLCLPRLPPFAHYSHSLLLILGWEEAVSQGMWQQSEEPFISWKCFLRRWWWLLGCAAVHDIVTEGIFLVLWQWQFLSWFLLNISPASTNCSTQEATVDLNN